MCSSPGCSPAQTLMSAILWSFVLCVVLIVWTNESILEVIRLQSLNMQTQTWAVRDIIDDVFFVKRQSMAIINALHLYSKSWEGLLSSMGGSESPCKWLPAHSLRAVFLERDQRLLGPCHKVATGLGSQAPCVGLSFLSGKGRQWEGRCLPR